MAVTTGNVRKQTCPMFCCYCCIISRLISARKYMYHKEPFIGTFPLHFESSTTTSCCLRGREILTCFVKLNITSAKPESGVRGEGLLIFRPHPQLYTQIIPSRLNIGRGTCDLTSLHSTEAKEKDRVTQSG